MIGGVDKWIMVKKEDLIQMQGKMWYWCPYHKHPHGHFNGLYSTLHKPEDHKEWKGHRLSGQNGQRNGPPVKLPDKPYEPTAKKLMTVDLTGRLSVAAFTTVLNVDKRTSKLQDGGAFLFGSDSSTVICDNSANVLICNDQKYVLASFNVVEP